MKTLFILKKDPDPTIKLIIQESKKESEAVVIDIREYQDYIALVDSIERCDSVVTW